MLPPNTVRVLAKELQLEKSSALGPVEYHSHMMHPFIHDKDLLVAEPITFEQVREGDIITYREKDKFPTWRVVRKESDRLILRPDNYWGLYVAAPGDVLSRIVERRRGDQRLTAEQWPWRIYASWVLIRHKLGWVKDAYKRHIIGPWRTRSKG